MPSCDICGDSVEASDHYDCTYCEGSYCGAHRVPESHDCVFAAALESPWESKLDEDRKYGSTVNRQARGNTSSVSSSDTSTSSQSAAAAGEERPKRSTGERDRSKMGPETKRWRKTHDDRGRDFDNPSPDVNPDGSIAGKETARLHGSSENSLAALYRRFRLCVKTPLRSLTWLVLSGLLAYAVYVFLTT
jgi:hypothetical protein